jgi:hypothetical protein
MHSHGAYDETRYCSHLQEHRAALRQDEKELDGILGLKRVLDASLRRRRDGAAFVVDFVRRMGDIRLPNSADDDSIAAVVGMLECETVFDRALRDLIEKGGMRTYDTTVMLCGLHELERENAELEARIEAMMR